MNKQHWAGIAAGLLVGGLALSPLPSRAQGAIDTRVPPDVQIVAMPIGRQWGVTIVYRKPTPRPVAEARLKELLTLTGWQASDVSWENRPADFGPDPANSFATPKEKSSQGPSMPSITFVTTGKVVDFDGGTMDVAPLARALRDESRVHVTYLLPQDVPFHFHGLRHYSDASLDVNMATSGQGAYTYVVNIKNHALGNVVLPRFEDTPATSAAQQTRIDALKARRRMVGTGLVALLALAAGILVYLWATRLGNGRA